MVPRRIIGLKSRQIPDYINKATTKALENYNDKR